jgi:hypothetical protein
MRLDFREKCTQSSPLLRIAMTRVGGLPHNFRELLNKQSGNSLISLVSFFLCPLQLNVISQAMGTAHR